MHCITQPYSIGVFYTERNAIIENPTYQRESAIWSPEKQKLFIDSLVNAYDVPKIYFHDLRNDKKSIKKYAIIDGKQRLDTIYKFLDGEIALDKDFKLSKKSEYTSLKPGSKFKDFSEGDREKFKSINLSVVLVEEADEDDIEDLFFRLNNGEPLNAAEKRNAMGGDLNQMIREVSVDPFFKKKLAFTNKRYGHFEIAAKLILLEKTEADTGEIFSDLKKKFLDRLVADNRNMSQSALKGLQEGVKKNLGILKKIFEDKDSLLTKQAMPPMYYIFVKAIFREYGHRSLNTLLRKFLVSFNDKRRENLLREEEKRDSALLEFGRLVQQGTNDINSLKGRVSILTRFFLQDNPEVLILDKKRQFTIEERHAIYYLSGKKCAECKRKFNDITDMEADHIVQWAYGGETNLKNARGLCADCNKKLAQRLK
jgi:hypothetical protein